MKNQINKQEGREEERGGKQADNDKLVRVLHEQQKKKEGGGGGGGGGGEGGGNVRSDRRSHQLIIPSESADFTGSHHQSY